MAERSKIGTAIVVSVLIAVIISMGLVYVLYPYILEKDKGVIQTKSISLTNDAYIFGSQTSAYTVANNTQLTITTRGGTKLDVRFTAQAIIALATTFTGSADWWVAAVLASGTTAIGNDTVLAHFYDGGAPTGTPREVPSGISIEYLTGTLAAGNYNITIQWESRTPQGGLTYLLFDDVNLHVPRVLVAQEIVS